MGEIGGVIALLAVLFAVGWALTKLRDVFWRGANRNVLARKSHREGQDATRAPLTFTTSSPAPDVISAIVRHVDLPHGVQSKILRDLYIDSTTDSSIDFASGSRIGTSFRSRLQLDGLGGTVSGRYDVVNWTENDGIVADLAQLKYLRRKIAEAVAMLNDSAS